ncbi:MAG TPA: TetR/AcrR family transcriptional regulator [Streptosporangiaceae bacterium]|nr:TetR/AcrR family transcriptional regulator [Streptosporangiaceae bacterium]
MRERLVSAAAEVFAVSGYHASKVSDIVGRAGVAQGTFYLYFRSKEAVFLELVDRFFTKTLAETLGAADPHEAATAADVAAQVRAMWRTLIVRCRQQPAAATAVLRDAPALGPEIRDRVRGYYEAIADGVAAYITVASRRGLTRRVDARLAGWLVQGLVDRAMYYALVIDPGADAGWLADQLMTVEGGGLLTHWDDAWLTPRAPEGGRSR